MTIRTEPYDRLPTAEESPLFESILHETAGLVGRKKLLKQKILSKLTVVAFFKKSKRVVVKIGGKLHTISISAIDPKLLA